MILLLCKDLEIGTRVILTNPDADYDIGRNNPKVGTTWECVGSITDYSNSRVDVMWDNGRSNSYKDRELSPACEGRCKSIWE